MEFRDMRGLVALAELGGIARAAERLHLSPPAIHKQLKRLEDELGVRLYERVGRRLRLTRAAELLLPYCRDVLAEYDTALAALDEWKGLKRGIIRVGAGPATSVHLLPGLLRAYRNAFPGMDVLVETGNSVGLIEKLATGSLDLALLAASRHPVDTAITVEHSWRTEFVFVSNIDSTPTRCRVAELRTFPFILFRKGSRMQDVIEGYFDELNFNPSVIMTFDNADAIKAMIHAGLGVSLLPFWIVHDDLRLGMLRLIRQREPSLFARFELVRRTSNYVPNPVAAFVDLARRHQFAALHR